MTQDDLLTRVLVHEFETEERQRNRLRALREPHRTRIEDAATALAEALAAGFGLDRDEVRGRILQHIILPCQVERS